MSVSDTNRNLLFGVLAIQSDLLNAEQFAASWAAWAANSDIPLGDWLVEKGWLSDADRTHLDALLQRKLDKCDGDFRVSLMEVALSVGHVKTVIDADDARPRGATHDAPGSDGHLLLSTIPRPQDESRQRYTLTRLHAKGGIGQVWLARDNDIGREVALKELRPERADNKSLWARFLAEARVTGQLEHPGIVPVYEMAEEANQDRPFYTMRFVRGRTLSQASTSFHKRRGQGDCSAVEWTNLLNQFVAVCQAIDYAHSRGVIHRDLKGANIALGDFGEVMVLDWGLAKIQGESEQPIDETNAAGSDSATGSGATPVHVPEDSRTETTAGEVLGTPAYMAPEQAAGQLDAIDERTDVYGLGAIFFELLTGEPPFHGSDTADLLRRVIEKPPARPRSIVGTTPAALEAICLKALSKNQDARFASAGQLAAEVQRFLADEPVECYEERIGERTTRWVRHHKATVSTAVGLLFAAAVSLSIGSILLAQANTRIETQRDIAEEQRDRAREQRELALQRAADAQHNLGLVRMPKYWHIERRTEIDDEDALVALMQTIAIREELVQAYPEKLSHASDLATAHFDLGFFYKYKLEDDDAANTAIRRSREIRERVLAADPSNADNAASLAFGYCELGFLDLASKQDDEALEWFEKGLELADRYFQESESHALVRAALVRSLEGRAAVLTSKGEFDDAAAIWDRVVSLESGERRAAVRVDRATARARAGDHAAAAQEAEELASQPNPNPEMLYGIGIVFGAAAGALDTEDELPEKDKTLQQTYVTRAFEMLHQAVEKGLFDEIVGDFISETALIATLSTDDDIKPLRGRAEFVQWLAAIRARGKKQSD